MAKGNELTLGFNHSHSIPCTTASGACYLPDLRELLMPEPIYETRIAKKEEPVSDVTDTDVTVMRVQDYDPNVPLIDADRFNEEGRINRQLALQADARLAAFMHNCRELRESHPDELATTLDTFVDNLINLYFDGRAPLPTTPRHSATMKLVLKAELANLIASHGQGA